MTQSEAKLSQGQDVAPPAAVSLTQQVSSGFVWLLIQAAGTKTASVAGNLILAWLLAKEDFGLIALAYTAAAFATVAQRAGHNEILVHRQRHFKRWANPAFWMSLAVGGIGLVALIAAAPIAASVFHEPRLIGLILVIAVCSPVDALSLVPNAKLQIGMRFRTLGLLGVSMAFLNLGLSVVFALLGFGAFSFVLPRPILSIINAAVLWRAAPVRIKADPQVRRWKYMLSDSGYLFGIAVAGTIGMFGDNLILGLVAPKSALGSYYFAFSMSLQTIQLVMSTMQSALFPALSKLVHDPVRQVQAYLRATRATGLIACYGCGLQAVLCGPVLRLVFASKWDEAIPIIRFLSIAMALYAMFGSTWALFPAQGRFRAQFICTSCHTLGLLAAVTTGAVLGEGFGVSIGWAVAGAIFYPIISYVGIRFGNGTWYDMFRLAIYPVGLLITIFSIPMLLELTSVTSPLRDILFVLITTPATMIGYGLLVRWLAPGPWKEICERFASLLGRVFAGGRNVPLAHT